MSALQIYYLESFSRYCLLHLMKNQCLRQPAIHFTVYILQMKYLLLLFTTIIILIVEESKLFFIILLQFIILHINLIRIRLRVLIIILLIMDVLFHITH